jgi:succinate dehydrogenase/fumarate reductase cytochrome b subunit
MKITDRTLARVQAGSGLVFAIFLTLHLANTIAAAVSQSFYDGLQRAFRVYYQFPAVEIVCVAGSALTHITAGVMRIVRRRGLRPVTLHRASGYFLLLAFAGHVTATRGPSLLAGMPIDLSYLTFSLSTYPWFFYPYYMLLFASGAYHLLNGSATALRIFGVAAPRPRFAVAAVVVLAGVAGIVGIGGVLHPVDTHRFPEFRAFLDSLTQRLLTSR